MVKQALLTETLHMDRKWGMRGSLKNIKKYKLWVCLLKHPSRVSTGKHVLLLTHAIPMMPSQNAGGLLRWSPIIPTFWHSCSSLWVLGEPNDWLLMNRIWQRWWNIISAIRWHEILTSLLPGNYLYCRFDLHALKKQAAILRRHIWQKRRIISGQYPARNRGPLCTDPWETESCQRPHEFGSRSFSSQALRCLQPRQLIHWRQPVRDPETEDLIKLWPDCQITEVMR